jgi:GLPGLI family protein
MMIKILSVAFLFFLLAECDAQITSGKIVYERKTNLYKKLKEWRDVQDWIKEGDKTKVDVFELCFNDSLSVFKPEESDLKENYSWATAKNTAYQNTKSNSRYMIKSIWGEEVYLTDTLYKRHWKITASKRNICGYNCRKAIWDANDSTRIYAWYCNEIVPGIGPESFFGLPGAILGLASEDGGVIYFAKTVEAVQQQTSTLLPPKTKNKIYSSPELRTRLEKEYGKEKWGKAMIESVFGYW